MQVTRTIVRTSCTETQVRTASLVPPSLAVPPVGTPPGPARSEPLLLLRRLLLTLHHPFSWEGREREWEGGWRRGCPRKRWSRAEGGSRGVSLPTLEWGRVGLEGGDGSPWPPIRLPVASTLYKHSLVPLAWRTHTPCARMHNTHTEGDLYRQPESERERRESALRNRKVHREESGRQKVREGEGGRQLLSISCAPTHPCTLTDLKHFYSSCLRHRDVTF